MRQARRPHAGFTLLELLVVIAITGILLALVLAAVQQARAAAARIQCADRLRQLGLAAHNYESLHHSLPPGISIQGGKSPYLYMGWQTRLLPFIEQEELWQAAQAAYKAEPKFFINPPHTDLDTVVKLYICPSDSRIRTPQMSHGLRVAFTSYLGNSGTDYTTEDGLLYADSQIPLSVIPDGASHAILAGERPPSADLFYGWWYAGMGQGGTGSCDMIIGARERNHPQSFVSCPEGPYEFSPGKTSNPCDQFHYWSLHPGGAQFLFADGSVHFLGYGAKSILPKLATRAGGEEVELPD